jgi:hypothetical protein
MYICIYIHVYVYTYKNVSLYTNINIIYVHIGESASEKTPLKSSSTSQRSSIRKTSSNSRIEERSRSKSPVTGTIFDCFILLHRSSILLYLYLFYYWSIYFHYLSVTKLFCIIYVKKILWHFFLQFLLIYINITYIRESGSKMTDHY